MPESSPETLSHPNPPPHFTVFGVPVRVASSFWLIGILFGMMGGSQAAAQPGGMLGSALTWTAIVFFSIMLHELGHALTARAFGARPAITLYMMGGLTRFDGGRMTRVQSGLISLAGPSVGLVVGAFVSLATRGHALSPMADGIVNWILWVNVYWSIINLLPVVPLDGGHILAVVLGPKRAFATSVISALVGSGVAALALLILHQPWIAMIFGAAALTSVRQARYGWYASADQRLGLHDQLTKARAGIVEGRPDEVKRIGDDVVLRARTAIVRNGGLLAIAWAEASRGHTMSAREALERLERGVAVDSFLLAAVEEALGSPARARTILEAARRQGVKSNETTKFLIDLCAREGDLASATRVAIEDADALGQVDGRAVLTAAMSGSAHGSAAELAARLFALYGDPADAVDEARALALSGNGSRALEILESLTRPSQQARVVSPETLRDDPAFKTLRDDARFQRLLSA
jgi:Zn-dependent protease